MAVDLSSFDYRDEEQLREALKGRSRRGVAKARGVDRTTINKWADHFGIPVEVTMPGVAPSDTLKDQIKIYLKRSQNGNSVEQIADKFNCPPKEVRAALTELEAEAVLVRITPDDEVCIEREIAKTEEPFHIHFQKFKEVIYPIGVLADPHFGSNYERRDVVEAMFDRFEQEGVETVFLPGNMIDGEARFNKFHIHKVGVEQQVGYFVENWPQREGITTCFVTGDDHEGWYTQREGLDVGRKIELDAEKLGRSDLVYLGHMERDILFKQDYGEAAVRVIHAGGGSAYATSYSSQKYAESLQGGEKPKIVIVGHFHKYDVAYPREVYMIQPGCCQDQTPFMRKNRIQAHVGGVILWVRQNELGIFTSVRHEFFPFFDKRFYQFHWEKPKEVDEG